jgi:uncharacterized protein YyaL (SSP411 family)
MDESMPSGYAVATYVLLRLGHLLGETRYAASAEKAIKAAWDNILRTPYAHNTLLDAVEEYLYPTQVIVLRGEAPQLGEWQQRCVKHFSPRRLVIAIPGDASGLPGLLQQRAAKHTTVAYVCDGYQCQAPIDDMSVLEGVLEKSGLR